ncbi:MAG: ATP-binding cassette domain-containing protein [Aggregatilineaceae bacterium]
MAGNGKNGAPLVYMENISRYFGLIAALESVYFTVDRGEIVGLLGDNGAGKSTLIKVLTGVHPATSGQIYFEGQPVRITSPKVARAMGIETVYQDLALVNLMSISRNFFLGRTPERQVGPVKLLDKELMNRLTVQALADIGIEIRRPEEEVLRMSGGERQSIAIGRAKYFGSKLLILDEPTSALSVGETRKVLGYTQEAKKAGLGVIFITHNIGHVYQVADRFTIISHGHKVGDFLKGEVSQEEISQMIMGGPVPDRLVDVVAEREAALRRLSEQMADRVVPIIIQQQARVRRRHWLIAGALIALVLLIAGLLVGGGAFSEVEPTPTITPVPTVSAADLPDQVKTALDQLANDPDPGRRAIAASMLGADRFREWAEAFVEPLLAALKDPAHEVRAAAAKSLGKIADPRAIDPLQELLRDNYSNVRNAAAEALQVGFDLYCSDAEGCKPKGALH